MNRAERRRQERENRKAAGNTSPGAKFAGALQLYNDGKFGDALKAAQKLLAADKGHLDALQLAGMISLQLGKIDAALAYLADKTRLDPDNAHGYVNFGAAQQISGDLEGAVECFRRAIALDPEMADAHTNLGITLRDMNYFAEAEDALRRALELSPGEARVTFSLATIIQSRGRPAEAIQIFDAALALGADNAETRYQRSFGYFSQGYFSGAAIDDYDMRWQAETFPSNWREFPQSLWQGEDLAGKKILLWAEQGIGDHIIFSSVVPALVGEGASVMVECDPRLKPLFARSFKGAEIVACEEMPALATQSPDIDFQIPLASMCLRRRAAQEDGFPMGRYLEPDTDLKEKIKARMDAEAGGRPLIGIAWRSARAKIGPLKSMPLDMWGPILTGREALFVNLQYGETNEEVAEAINTTGADIYTDPDIDRFDDLEGFAALVDCLDLVVTTSNVTAHFAGGLGKPCVQALQKSPIWYWGLEATPIAFYASVDRIWQEEENKWGDVIAKISALLDENLS